MSNRPLISAVIIVLNTEKYVKEVIESVFAHTYDHLELLLVDDGSTEGSRARAKYVGLLDCDAVWMPRRLVRQAGTLRARRKAGIVCGLSKYWPSRRDLAVIGEGRLFYA